MMSASGNNKENGGREKKGKEGRRKREGEGKGEKGERRKEERRRGKGEEGSGIQAHLGCLLVGGVTTGSSLSAIWSATLYPPTRCLRMSHRVRLAALVGSFTAISKSRCVRIANGNSRLVVSSSWQYAATCRAVSRPSPHEQTGVITSGTRRSNRKARSPILPVLIWTRRELSAF